MNRATGSLAVIMAMLGFSFALATSSGLNDSQSGGEAAQRAVGTGLDFANPFVSDATKDRDLGDSLLGSALARLVRAKGGLAPYKFKSDLKSVGAGVSDVTGLTLLTNGILSGLPKSTQSASAGSIPFRFKITVTDSSVGTGSSKSEIFRISFFSTTAFRFANSGLADGVLFNGYSDNLLVLNGAAPIKFATSSVTLDGVPVASLSELGLSLSDDGSLFGVPLKKGLIKITAVATDKNTNKAAGRSGTGNSQVFSLNIADSKTSGSIISATAITIKTGFGVGKDAIAYAGIANLNGEALSKFSGQPFSFRIGTFTSQTATFDAKGKAASAKKVKPLVTATIKNNGLFSFADKMDTIQIGSGLIFAIEVRLGDALVGSEVLAFTSKPGKNGARTLTYKPSGASDIDGTSQLLSVKGVDEKSGIGDSWKVSFICRAPASVDISNSSKATVSIGKSFVNDVVVTPKSGKLTGVKGAKNAAVVTTFALDTKKGKGAFTTGVLPVSVTGIGLATTASTNNFATNITFATTGFAFQNSLAITAAKAQWSSIVGK